MVSERYEYEGACFTLNSKDGASGTLRCIVGGDVLWSRRIALLGEQHQELMFRYAWSMHGGRVRLVVEGEHWRGASVHQRRVYHMDREGVTIVEEP